MTFQIPDNLSLFSAQGLGELRAQAQTEYDALFASVTTDTVTDEQLDRLEALRAFTVAADTQIATFGTQTDRADRLAALAADPEPTTPATTPVETTPPVETAPAADAVTAAAVTPTTTVRLADVISQGGDQPADVVPADASKVYATIVAAADVPGVPNGAELDLLGVAKAFLARTAGYAGLKGSPVPVQHGVAVIQRDYPAEFVCDGDAGDYEKLLSVANESRLPGGSLLKSAELKRAQLAAQGKDSLVAAAGWCAPSETIYDVCFQGTTDGLADFPEVQARRGGIRSNTGIDWSTIYGEGTGFFNLTEAQVAAGSPTKTCLEISCPSFADTRLGVTGLCLTGNILTNRGYPEYVATFVRGALVASAHQINNLQVAAVATGSTAVSLAAQAPWDSDRSVVSQVLGAVEMAVVDLKYRLRLAQSATLEIILPFWILAQMRADLTRRTGTDLAHISVADSQIASWFAMRGVRPQFIYDWQDAFSDAGVGAGATTAVNQLATSLKFILYPAGTWVRAVNDVITLNSIYDSTKLATNQNTHLFTETGWAMIKMCPISRIYTVPICPSGATSDTQTVDCVTS